MDYKKRIEYILDVYKINASEFADKIDVPRSSISHILSGRNKPSLDFMIKVKEVYPDLDWNFLILGKLPIFIRNDNTLNEKSFSDVQDATIELPFENISNIKFSAGNNSNIANESLSDFNNNLKIEKVIFFYNNGSFKVYQNEI